MNREWTGPSAAAGEERISPAVRVTASQLVAEAVYQLVTRVLAVRGIGHLLLKGPHLGAIAYAEPWQRDYGDLDVLVRPGDFHNALAALADGGFSLPAPPAGREATIGAYYNRGLLAPHGWLVELHRAFSGYELFRIDYDALFARAVPFRFGQTEARGLALEDLLLHLVVHAAKSHFRGIAPKHVQDVALLAALHTVSWAIFLTRAEEAGGRTASWVLLSAAVRIHGAAVPEDVLRRLRPARARRWWLGLWLTWERFPLFRWQHLPVWLGRLLVAPAIVDRLRDGVASGLRFAKLRVRDAVPVKPRRE